MGLHVEVESVIQQDVAANKTNLVFYRNAIGELQLVTWGASAHSKVSLQKPVNSSRPRTLTRCYEVITSCAATCCFCADLEQFFSILVALSHSESCIVTT